jgi:hypothetical protein
MKNLAVASTSTRGNAGVPPALSPFGRASHTAETFPSFLRSAGILPALLTSPLSFFSGVKSFPGAPSFAPSAKGGAFLHSNFSPNGVANGL